MIIRRFVRHLSTSKSSIRINAVGIQHLAPSLQNQLFGKSSPRLDEDLINMAKRHLKSNNLIGKKSSLNDPIEIQLPSLQGNTLDEHFYKLGSASLEPYNPLIDELLNLNIIEPQFEFAFQSGWTRYAPGEPSEKVPYPLEDSYFFDVETMYKVSQYPVMAVALSDKAWYGWVSPYLTEESTTNDHLIPLNTFETEKFIVGHNVSYDRARALEEYNLKQTKAFWMDTMALHVSVSGMCTRQRGTWIKHNKKEQENTMSVASIKSKVQNEELQELLDSTSIEDPMLEDNPWINKSSLNSLERVAEFYCKIKLKKDIRNSFATEDPDELRGNFDELMQYCAKDVFATGKVFQKVYPKFKKLIPHPVTLAALKDISSCILPTTTKWEDYIETSERLYQESRRMIEKNLHVICEETVKLKDDPTKPWENDPWLSQLDWTIDPIRLTKKGEIHKNQKLPGYPNWYKQLIVKNELKLTTKTRTSPLLLKLAWNGNPLYWIQTQGWCFKVPKNKTEEYEKLNFVMVSLKKLSEDPGFESIRAEDLKNFTFVKVPHPDGPSARVTNCMTKSCLGFFEKGFLNSQYPLAKDALQMAVASSYWTSSRERIMNQFVVFEDDMGYILPQIIPMGTITRRAVENTWLTASNAKKNRLGSELKSLIEAPKGYCFVGADVDSEELWIASLIGDSVFKIHGGTAIGWMTLEGTKNEGTDLHSKTAKILGISRNEAKIFNYGRIYGAGIKFTTTLLKKFNPALSDAEAKATANALYTATKGISGRYDKKSIWYGGSESIIFNRLEAIAEMAHPKTPVLGAGITAPLQKANLSTNNFLTSRINWAIQSSGVDYLHLLIISMDYLIKLFDIDARLCITVHDEIRYLVKEEDKFRAAYALQISNLWTRAMFCQQLGINEVPQSCAFFSAVDLDFVLRKEVDLDCVTPSNPDPIPCGKSLDIYQLLQQEDIKGADFPRTMHLNDVHYRKRTPVIEMFDKAVDDKTRKFMVSLQIAQDKTEFTKWKRSRGELIVH
uniref:DNA polymerase gamma n=1 Tax=Komagataella pastoris TaxID=4922 RepID=DPOG_PICPA|nr:RecName: Full=DNA polymerase gamma; AltName: Full=Mitochondrial DNA polymerase catalytic subunit [Komagataella pastoris]AAB17118.1 DNA polymerase gamma [Komagataella pastoris]